MTDANPHGASRRAFLRTAAATTAAMPLASLATAPASAATAAPLTREPRQQEWQGPPRLKFAVIGLNHGHITSMTNTVLRGGGELTWVYAKEPDLVKPFLTRFPQARLARRARAWGRPARVRVSARPRRVGAPTARARCRS